MSKTSVLQWIQNFRNHAMESADEADRLCREDKEPVSEEFVDELLYQQYRNGYCYFFAKMLEIAFPGGEVCWTAPFGHFVYKDAEGYLYDITGLVTKNDSEAFYFIPEKYLGYKVRDFLHAGTECNATKEELISIMKKYCSENSIAYLSEVEDFLL